MTGYSYGMVLDNWVLMLGLHYINILHPDEATYIFYSDSKLLLKIEDGLHYVLISFPDAKRSIRRLIQKPFSSSGLDFTGYFSSASPIQIIHKILTLISGNMTYPENSNFILCNYFSLGFSKLK